MKKENSYSTLTVLKRFIPFGKPYSVIVFLFMLFSIMGVCTDILQAYFVNNLVDLSLWGKTEQLVKFIYYIIGAVVIGFTVTYISKYLYGYFSSSMLRDIRGYALNYIRKLHVSYIEKNNSGDLVSRLTSDISVFQRFVENEVFNILSQCFLFIIAFIYLSTINWKLLLVSITLTPIALLLVNKLGKPIGGYSNKIQEHMGKAISQIIDAFNGISIVKSYNIGDNLYKKYKFNTDSILNNILKIVRIGVLSSPLHVILRLMPIVICIVYGSYLVVNKNLTPGQLISFTFLLTYIVSPLAFLPDIINGAKSAMGAAKRLVEVFDLPCERIGGASFEDYSDSSMVSFNNVSFSYDGEASVLNGVSFELGRGEKKALVGASGSGKSTIFKLLCEFYQHEQGQIKVYDKELKQWKLDALRSQVSLVSQDAFLFPTSIYENISYGRPDATKEEIIEAAKAANAHEFIMELSEGYDTLVNERGVKLSGGQKQRIAIARAILKDSPIILLDEATSALDNQSEALVQQALDRITKDKSVLVIAHRLSTIKNVNEIMVMDKGRIIEKGSHEKLMN
ncbi:MAG: ABC transporter ATP-binding protein, partial [Bacillota bacterium]|nr:ABC transporter ATP-binding protein [Bacillota bacterium]